MAVYFPRGQQSIGDIRQKFIGDLRGARTSKADGIVFVTNQELTLAERKNLVELASPEAADLYHLERVTTILDDPRMTSVRKQFLQIVAKEATAVVLGGQGGMAPGAGGGGECAIGPAHIHLVTHTNVASARDL